MSTPYRSPVIWRSMNLISLRERLERKKNDTVVVRGEEVKRFGCVKLEERVLAPVTRAFTSQKAVNNWYDYSNSELWLYHTGNCKAEQWSQLANIWYKLYGVKDPNTVVHSAYGHIFTPKPGRISQWLTARDRLLEDRHTRRAFVQFLLPEWSGDAMDVPCSVIATFKRSERDPTIKNEAEDFGIDVVYFMRSSDIVYGLPHDIVWAKSLSMRMQMSLAKVSGFKSCRLSKKAKVTFVTSDLHEYSSHPVISTGLIHTFNLDYVEEMLDYIVFSPGGK